MSELENAANELHYWDQLLTDNEKIIADLTGMNNQIDELINLAARILTNSDMAIDRTYAGSIIDIVRNMQKNLEAVLVTMDEQTKLINGRFKMIRTDLNL